MEDSLASQEGWADIVVDLRGEGLDEDVITTVLREHQAWVEEAQEWKQHGYPYDEIVRHLRDEVAADWEDVAHALLEIGLAPADTLRVVLPLLGEDDPLPAVRMALLEFPDGSGEEEAREVIDYYFPGMAEDEIGESATSHPSL
ncbi:MAG: hypothetical protein HXX12_01165 [Geothrix sp.]|uniref:hypothetical protein n=1 Tax=Geothrix sp. TaxID=1962974 RepID=UPI0017CD9683|nr:hypothetical protein [Geothrix sp.]NWJ39563.1 hypothetical protein [Geothrix sp.]WIL19216.1 MAG: hypothetical protein QOZ81_001718 [Geothrix sp.]